MQISSDEARALAFIAALIGLTLLGRWVDRPRELGLDQPAVDVVALAERSEAGLGPQQGRQEPPAKPRGASPGRAGAPTEPLDLNRATAAELERLPGVGPALAGRIVAYRDSVGRFRTIEQLDSVKGIGPALMARLKPLLRLSQ